MSEPLPDRFWQGIDEFNQQEYYACHDTLEELWLEAIDPQKTFYQGILQIAVACYHLNNRNWHGAVMLLGEGTRRLDGYRPEYGGIRVDPLLAQSYDLLDALQQNGSEGVGNVLEAIASGDEVKLPCIEMSGNT